MTRLAPAPERADKWISRAATATVAGLAGIAGAISYSHMRQLAAAHGDTGWAALTIGTAASLAANIATADQGIVNCLIAGWPAVALLTAVKLLSGILEHRKFATIPTGAVTAGPSHAVPVTTPAGSTTPPSRSRPASQFGAASVAAARCDLAALDDAARAIRDELRRDGHPLTRDTLATRLRAAGFPVRNATLSPLLATLRAEPATVT